jgi:hypothetical protein
MAKKTAFTKRKKTTVREQYRWKVLSFEAQLSAGINRHSDDPSLHIYGKDPLHAMWLELKITVKCMEPKRFAGDEGLIIMPSMEQEGWFTQRVADVQHRDEHGNPKYTEREGYRVPVFDGPRCIGQLKRHRKADPWIAHVWLPFAVVKEFRTALSNGMAPYLELDVRRTWSERLIQQVYSITPGLIDE